MLGGVEEKATTTGVSRRLRSLVLRRVPTAVVHYNRALVFSRVGGLWPTHNFAHVPRLIDRRILERMEDVDFYNVAKLTRASRGRSTYNFWTTHLVAAFVRAVRVRHGGSLDFLATAS